MINGKRIISFQVLLDNGAHWLYALCEDGKFYKKTTNVTSFLTWREVKDL